MPSPAPSTAKPEPQTLRTRLINVAAHRARSARRLVLHLPPDCPFEPGLDDLLRAALHDPVPTSAA